MCGILGIYDPGGVNPQAARELLNLLQHRGPEAEGLWCGEDGRLLLGHRRLKIIDLSDNANQPMSSPCGRWTIIFNGEIFNYLDLRRLYRGPWNFRTSSDTEILLAMLTERGISALHDCVGMFAFALYDRMHNRLTLVRDRFGIKPLYFTDLPSDGFAFASEIPPLLKQHKTARPNRDMVRTYLETTMYDFSRDSFFQDVHSIRPGCALHVDLRNGKRQEELWYDMAARLPDLSGANEEDLILEGRRRLEVAIKDHLVADVRTGLNVSGGVDSSVLVAIAQQQASNIHVFTQDYPPPYSEEAWVREVIGNTSLHLVKLTDVDIRQALDRTVALQAEPFGGAFVIGYDYLYAAADQEGITVLLDGNGIDEVFLGYQKYHAAAVRLAANDAEWQTQAAEYRQFWQAEPPKLGSEAPTTQSIDGSDGARPAAITPSLRANTRILSGYKPATSFEDPVRMMAAADLISTKIPRGLRFNDRMSMGRSKELRVPFLDHRLVEFGFAIPRQYLLNATGSKALFRRIARGLIPESVAMAKKRSVQSPQREWLAEQWRGLVQDILTSQRFSERGWVNPVFAAKIYQNYIDGRRENSFFIWQWINLELWARRFLDGEHA